MRSYYTLLVARKGYWEIEYGSFSKLDALQEEADYREHKEKGERTKVIETDARQTALIEAVAALNSGSN